MSLACLLTILCLLFICLFLVFVCINMLLFCVYCLCLLFVMSLLRMSLFFFLFRKRQTALSFWHSYYDSKSPRQIHSWQTSTICVMSMCSKNHDKSLECIKSICFKDFSHIYDRFCLYIKFNVVTSLWRIPS